MTYEINVTRAGEYLYGVVVIVKDDTGVERLRGETSVCGEHEQEAFDYAEQIFLPDLRRNFPREIGGLVFPWEEGS